MTLVFLWGIMYNSHLRKNIRSNKNIISNPRVSTVTKKRNDYYRIYLDIASVVHILKMF